MSKLPKQYQFIDLSDYGRIVARWIANSLKNTSITPIHVTSWFIVSGFLAILCMLYDYKVSAAFFLILKSILDAADGELSRVKNTPSYIGRYYDSIADIILNFLFFITLWYITNTSIVLVILAFLGVQLQGTLYNYYYVILRNNVNGDTTSRIFEDSAPKAMKGEKQQTVNIFYKIYDLLYITFDKTIYIIDKDAMNSKPFPRWFMTLLSTFGLGFQLLVMAIMLVFNLEMYVVPFFIGYSIMILVFVGIRRYILV
ncbi:MAG: CDP-alcohol phosphatidyltransferase family protein [Bacteroidetes bacterium]|jgi:phosphatidylglycerophosphate synthase|nr:CDP-alcohol phosphatidyltransferase family protein [Bacteroidota bacterium]MDF1867755.1 CDP-alcohol phosphatidyltransferase family protein [Saprospiraceae bacterium]